MRYLKSLAELAALTYAVGFLGLVSAAGFDITDMGAVKAASLAAFPSVLAVLYGAAVKGLGNRNSALAVDTRDSAGK